MKGQVIFADQNQQEKSAPKEAGKKTITLSRSDYRDAIKEAYKEGLQEAKNTQISSDTKNDELNDPGNQFVHLGQKESTETKKNKEKGENEGEIEAFKTEAKRMQQTRHKLENIAERHAIELIRAKSVFPFTLFPDTIAIDTTKVTIVRTQMFATETIITIPLKDVADTHVQTALFLASVCIAYMPHSTSPGMLKPEEETISCLKREDAIRIKNILKGVLIATSEDIDLAKLDPEEVVNIVERVGHSEGID